MSPEIVTPHCGDPEHVVFSGKLKDTDDFVCVCLQPGLHYGFRFGAIGKPLKVSFSVSDSQVVGDFDWERIDGTDWTSLSVRHNGNSYTVWVSRPEIEGELPTGRFEIKGDHSINFEFEPDTIIHDLPFS